VINRCILIFIIATHTHNNKYYNKYYTILYYIYIYIIKLYSYGHIIIVVGCLHGFYVITIVNTLDIQILFVIHTHHFQPLSSPYPYLTVSPLILTLSSPHHHHFPLFSSTVIFTTSMNIIFIFTRHSYIGYNTTRYIFGLNQTEIF